jgi:hypothetical protein
MLRSSRRVIKSRWMSEVLLGKTALITGAARRLGRSFVLACARAGADIVIHHSNSTEEAAAVRQEITRLRCNAWIFQADFNDPVQAGSLNPSVNKSSPLFALINSAAIFDSLSLEATSLQAWQPSDGNKNPEILNNIPPKKWANKNESEKALLFLLTCHAYITGEILHLDSGRPLV